MITFVWIVLKLYILFMLYYLFLPFTELTKFDPMDQNQNDISGECKPLPYIVKVRVENMVLNHTAHPTSYFTPTVNPNNGGLWYVRTGNEASFSR